MNPDITPPIADQIGKWHTPAPSPLDILTADDESAALRLAYRMTIAYREQAKAAIAHVAKLTDQNRRLTDLNRTLLERLRKAGGPA